MSFIERHQGCPGPEQRGGCFGPTGEYYTVFGTELRFLEEHMTLAIIIGLLLFGLLFFLKKKEKITLPLSLMIIISLSTTIVLFFLLAYFFPVRVMY